MLVELSVVEQRYHAVMEVLSAGAPVVEVAARYGVSRKTVHAWIRRYRDDGLGGLADRSHRPHHHPWQLAPDVEARICELRRAHPRWGPRRLGHELARAGAGAGAVAVVDLPDPGPAQSDLPEAAQAGTLGLRALGAFGVHGAVAARHHGLGPHRRREDGGRDA